MEPSPSPQPQWRISHAEPVQAFFSQHHGQQCATHSTQTVRIALHIRRPLPINAHQRVLEAFRDSGDREHIVGFDEAANRQGAGAAPGLFAPHAISQHQQQITGFQFRRQFEYPIIILLPGAAALRHAFVIDPRRHIVLRVISCRRASQNPPRTTAQTVAGFAPAARSRRRSARWIRAAADRLTRLQRQPPAHRSAGNGRYR